MELTYLQATAVSTLVIRISVLFGMSDEHGAIIFVHPSLEGTAGIVKEPRPLPSPIFDWTHETTRSATHLITVDTFRTHRRCKIIFSHGGGTLPYIANRIAHLSAGFHLMDKSAESFLTRLRVSTLISLLQDTKSQ